MPDESQAAAHCATNDLVGELVFDVIVVGARCAGAVTAMLLARAGHKILLLDRAHFPSDTLSTHYVHQPGLAHLHRWGLLEEVLATGCPTLTSLSFHSPGVRLAGPAPTLGAITGGCAPRRLVLDHILVRAAVEAGAEFRPCSNMLDLHWRDGAVAGVVHGTRNRTPQLERASLVIGADGRNSTIARLTRAPYLRQDPRLTYTYYSYWSGIPQQGFRLYSVQGAGTACIPTHDDLTLLGLAFTRTGKPIDNRDRQQTYLSMLRQTSPELEQQLADAHQEERLFCCADQPNFFRQPHGPGWALVGDAAHTKDPGPARGITDAFTQADMLADHLNIPLDDHHQVSEALTHYAQWLSRAFDASYQYALHAARMDVNSHHQDLIDNQHDPAYVDRVLRAYAGILEPSPRRNEPLVTGAPSRDPAQVTPW
ncbi:NAD(P)/FAD-dependent oxidoreductase [Actinomadura harenae]|uniref:FAD-dependent oxidoreductase n=1 Tax=Actinomadura harenae TaxID=2483351 RepID=A0A3M2LX14_9ACTN|nr:FAD-dependent monooxygenase [Actinomadura harenae]RMI42114.1 FAD-dependent oxidoreductase [Actinomadura harenae]